MSLFRTLSAQPFLSPTSASADPVAFVIAVEQGVKDGFSLDLVTPEHYPQQIGWQFICTMVKDAQQEVKSLGKLEIKLDTTELQKVVDDALEIVQKAQEEAVAEQTTEGTQEQSEAVVEAPKKAGRPAKGK